HGSWTWLEVQIPRDRLVGWSASERLPDLPKEETSYSLFFLAPPKEGFEFTLRFRRGPIEVDAIETYPNRSTPALDAALAKLPDWTTSHGSLERAGHYELAKDQ